MATRKPRPVWKRLRGFKLALPPRTWVAGGMLVAALGLIAAALLFGRPAPEPVTTSERRVATATLPAPIAPRAAKKQRLALLSLPDPASAAWTRFAAPVPAGRGPRIAIVIDDLGNDPGHAREAIRLPAPVTLAFLPYGPKVAEQAAQARCVGHELLVHMPMEPWEATMDPGPGALYAALPEAELRRRLDANLAAFEGYVGINNHMGSRFTGDAEAMSVVFGELRRRGLLYMDSRTSPETVGPRLAREFGLPWTERDVFLDNEPTHEAIAARLAEVEHMARKHGTAVAIGHPHPETLRALATWIPEARARGFVFVPITAVAVPRLEMAGVPPASASRKQ